MFTESREEDWTSWVSGLSSYVVAADPAVRATSSRSEHPPAHDGRVLASR